MKPVTRQVLKGDQWESNSGVHSLSGVKMTTFLSRFSSLPGVRGWCMVSAALSSHPQGIAG